MTLRVLAAGAAVALLAGPAWADCEQDIQALEEQMAAAETGAPSGESEMPATKHQSEVLSGDAQTEASGAVGESDMPATQHQQQVLSGGEPPLETGAGSTGDVEAASPHQRQVVREVEDSDNETQASARLEEARQLAAAGDEAGCQAKVDEAEALLASR